MFSENFHVRTVHIEVVVADGGGGGGCASEGGLNLKGVLVSERGGGSPSRRVCPNLLTISGGHCSDPTGMHSCSVLQRLKDSYLWYAEGYECEVRTVL